MHKKYFAVPDLLLGFDTETTGLDVSSERAISYGFCAYERGRPLWSEHFFVRPDRPISPGAQRVHGVSMAQLDERYLRNEAVSVPMGLIRAVGVLREYLGRGAKIVGANVTSFDLEMLRRSYASVLEKNLLDDLPVRRFPVIDVIEHDEVMESRAISRRPRSLTSLCHHYGVMPGGHDALSDARAAVEVFLAQVAKNDADRGAASPQISFALEWDSSRAPTHGS
ncbi:MAG: 3'-5' exonuclease [Acidobacteria bacterium]|nr:3'-5' exonuclease [Acidobacteriota bacterium]